MVKNGVESTVWMQNAAYVFVIPIVLTIIAAYFGMNNLATATSSIREQFVVFKKKHTWIMSFLYLMSFGSFIGYSAAFPLLMKSQFPEVNPLHFAFLGPLVGALIRPIGGWFSDKWGGARVTFYDVIVMIGATFGVVYFMKTHQFAGFLAMFLLLFITTGVANGSTFRMIPVIFGNNPKEGAAVLGFTSAIGCYGGYFIPKMFGYSINTTGSPDLALYAFILYYALSLLVTWYWYSRKNAEIKC